MANDRNRTDDLYGGPDRERPTDTPEDRVRGGVGDDVRGVADEEDDEFEDTDDLEDEEESDESM